MVNPNGDKMRFRPELDRLPRKNSSNVRLPEGKATRWAPSKKANAKQPKKKPD